MGRAAQTRRIALERMGELVMAAARTARADPALAAGQAAAARAISTRHRVRMPYGLRIAFCKKCKSHASPGSGARVRIGRSQTRAVRITCLLCGHTYRRILPKDPGQGARRLGEALEGAPASPNGGAGGNGAPASAQPAAGA